MSGRAYGIAAVGGRAVPGRAVIAAFMAAVAHRLTGGRRLG
jgi:hypothetical protein